MIDFRTPVAEATWAAIAETLAADGLIVLPTETVYGVAAAALRPRAVGRLRALKGREGGKPLQLLVDSPAAARRLAADWPPAAAALAAAGWPGPLTLVVSASAGVPAELVADDGTVGLRCPDHALGLELLRRVGPLAASSANRPGEPPALDGPAAAAALGSAVALVLDGGRVTGGLPSTVVRLTRGIEVLRVGAWSEEQVREVVPD